ncbi:hypothetical protein C5Z25_10125 [Lactobacillus sp. CBA3605]|uniref:hypothetical protein n=1 Tax=Lactobacillus sp. CBA3605 TaxID=2099788 RepID=UPI000CFCD403|nr:hypothetical protein [Lactobacillus sp. CBA3605]AVK62110.1 hypothetical protein C5Z25_10125 [Lactobacillus sp. CBA3605]
MTNDAQLSITQLNGRLQHQAVEAFAKFYQRLYDANNLELMSDYDVASYMTDINEHLALTRFMTKAQRLADSVTFSFADYLHLIDKLDQTYFTSGNPALTWNEWYASHFSQVATS